jgi:hypothetical protein
LIDKGFLGDVNMLVLSKKQIEDEKYIKKGINFNKNNINVFKNDITFAS